MIGIVEQAIEGTQLRIQTFYGNSEEDKPVTAGIADGSIFIETDTHDIYMFDATAEEWKEW